MVITVISPDKLTLSMFVDFYKTLYSVGKQTEVLPMNILFGDAQKEGTVRTIKDLHDPDKHDIFVTIKTKFLKQRPDGDISSYYKKSAPDSLVAISDYIIAFDIYSTSPIIIKGSNSKLPSILERWENNINKLGG
jgi:hypothetical protein